MTFNDTLMMLFAVSPLLIILGFMVLNITDALSSRYRVRNGIADFKHRVLTAQTYEDYVDLELEYIMWRYDPEVWPYMSEKQRLECYKLSERVSLWRMRAVEMDRTKQRMERIINQ